MMDNKFLHCLIWTYVVGLISFSVQADIGDKVHVNLQYELHRCLSKGNSLHSTLKLQLLCLQSAVFQCMLFHDIHEEPHVITERVCGVINTGLLP